MNGNLKVEWIDRGFEPTGAPDPKFPNGVDLDLSKDQARACRTDLPYPAKRCGYFLLTCDACGFSGLITTAGRPDDPRSIKIACNVLLFDTHTVST